MKKVYMKPVIIFEDFSLSTSVAGTCEKPTNTPTQFSCGIEMSPGNVIFLETMVGICNVTSSDQPYDGACYDVPMEDCGMFNS